MSLLPKLSQLSARTLGRRTVSSFCTFALAVLLLPTAAVLPATAQNPAHTLVGHPAPAFALKDFHNKTIHLSQFRGKIVLLNFWASWCAPCQLEMPSFVKWQSQYRGKLQVIGIDMDDDLPKAKAVARKLKVNYPLLVGNAHVDEHFGGFTYLPVSFIIDAHGRIRGEYKGGNHVKAMHAEIKRLMAHSARK